MILAITDSNGDSIDVELPDDWVNYWDLNPQQHGGLFTQFRDGSFRVIETVPPQELPNGLTEHEHMLHDYHCYYSDYIHQSDAGDCAQDMLKREISSLNNATDLLQVAVDGRLGSCLAWAAVRQPQAYTDWVADDRYTEHLPNKYGIPRELL